MKRIILIILFPLTLFLAECASLNSNKWSRTDADIEIYSVFCNYFAEKLSEKQISIIVLSEKTDFDKNIQEVMEVAELSRVLLYIPALEKATLNDLLAENSSNSEVIPLIKSKKRIVFLSYDERSEIFQNGGWEDFWKKYNRSQGIMTLSKIGYNIDKKQALLYYSNSCGMKCGGGGLAFFGFIDGEWKLKFIFPVWIS